MVTNAHSPQDLSGAFTDVGGSVANGVGLLGICSYGPVGSRTVVACSLGPVAGIGVETLSGKSGTLVFGF